MAAKGGNMLRLQRIWPMSVDLKSAGCVCWLTNAVSLLCCCFLLSGCLIADGPSNNPSKEQLRIQSSTPQAFAVIVADNISYSVPIDGRVTIGIPPLGRGCTRYLLGVKLEQYSCDDLPAIKIRNPDGTMRKLSLNQLHKLPQDDAGFYLLKVE